jgi:hypothetical protein
MTVDWREVRKHVSASKKTPREVKGLLLAFFEAGDWNIYIEGTSWIHARPPGPLSDIEMLTDTNFKSFTIKLPVEPCLHCGPPYGYCAVDISTETEEAHLKCLASWYPPSTKLDLDVKLLAQYITDRLKSQLSNIVERLGRT